jgi:hypothetical protein
MADRKETSGWAAGGILFAGLMMIMVGIWQALEGLIGIFENEFYVATRNYLLKFNPTWGLDPPHPGAAGGRGGRGAARHRDGGGKTQAMTATITWRKGR